MQSHTDKTRPSNGFVMSKLLKVVRVEPSGAERRTIRPDAGIRTGNNSASVEPSGAERRAIRSDAGIGTGNNSASVEPSGAERRAIRSDPGIGTGNNSASVEPSAADRRAIRLELCCSGGFQSAGHVTQPFESRRLGTFSIISNLQKCIIHHVAWIMKSYLRTVT